MKNVIHSIVASALVLSVAGIASAARPGTECVPNYAESGVNVYRVWGGAGSATWSPGTSSPLLCPLDASSPPGSVTINAFNGSDPNGQVACYVAGYTVNQLGWWSTTRWLCGNVGGCLSSAFPGTNKANTLSWSNPIGSSLSGFKVAQIECSVTNNSSSSMVMSY